MKNPDFHSHLADSPILSVDISEFSAVPPSHEGRLTVGIHPWLTDGLDTDGAIERLVHAIADPRVSAIGEAGLDTLRGAPIEEQAELLRRQLLLAEERRLPVVLHIVRAWDRLLRLYDSLSPTVNWAIHGITARPSIVSELARRGIFMSAGARTSAATAAAIPEQLLLVETDGNGQSIGSVIKQIAFMRSSSEDRIKAIAYENLNRFFS